MTNGTIERIWRKVIQFVTITEPVLGGTPTLDGVTDEATGLPAGISNVATKQLADRTAWLHWRHAASNPNRRNGIETCKLDNDGIPAFAAVTASPLSANIVANNSTPLVLSFAGGFDEHGPIDYYAFVNANEAVTPESGSGPEFLFAVYDPATDTVDFESYENPYALGLDAPDPASYSFWYNPATFIMYKSTGSAWDQAYAIFLGGIDYAFQTVNLEDPGKDISGGLVPTGTILPFAGEVAKVPYGYLICQGQEVSRATYRKLFILFGILYGDGNGTTTFNLPDLRGKFIRGFSDGGALDTSRVLGSDQSDSVGPHDHNALPPGDFIGYDPAFNTIDLPAGNNGRVDTKTDDAGTNIGTETRPYNIAVNHIIKY